MQIFTLDPATGAAAPSGNNTASGGTGNTFLDVFSVLARTYLQKEAIEHQNPVAYNQYAYGALANTPNNVQQNPYAQPVGSVSPNSNPQSGAINTKTLMVVGGVALAALILLKG